jgi:subtilase family serine protease
MYVAVLVAAVVVALVSGSAARAANGHANAHAVCPAPPSGSTHCYALVVTDKQGNPAATASPTGLDPATIKSVYGFPTASTAGAGTTIAIVDAYDDPTAENDLNVFSSTFGLPACTTANGCFEKVNQSGGTSYPKTNSGWALEISLDVQWAHAIAPGAKILLVEASSSSFANLLTAEAYAKTHAQYVSNSWGASEFLGESSYDSYFVQSGVSFFVSAGDSGLPAEYPSASPNVISVGGTTLHFDSGGSFTGETGWSGGGGGCSAYETAASAQSAFAQYGQVNCAGRRATPDVSLDADPSSGVSVYDTTSYYGQRGWFTVGGTSASSPMWAARSADAAAVVNASYVYGSSISFRDITVGNNGASCLVGFDLCTGRGSWSAGTSSPPPAQPSLGFAGDAQTLTAGQPSAPMQVSLSAAQTSDVTVTLTSSSESGQFAASPNGPWSSTLQPKIAAGQTTTPSFYYVDTRAGSPVVTASASGSTSASQTETVTAAALATIAISPGSATVPVGGTQAFSASGADAYGNFVSVSNASWSTDVPGASVTPSSGATTVFDAGATAGSGTVTATVSSLSGSAAVTVAAATAPSPPSNLTAGAQGKHIGLSWQATSSGVTYNVYRGTASGNEQLYASGLTGTSANDMGVTSGVTYYYYVTAVSAGVESAPSNEASASAK